MMAAAGLVLVTVLAASARLWWAFDLLTHFRLQYVALALVLCLVAVALQAQRTAAVLALVALVHGWAIKDLWLGGTAAATPAGASLRLVSANVFGSNPTREEVLELARRSDADLVMLVDAHHRRWRSVLSEVGGLYPHHAPEGWSAGAPVVLFSRHPILRERVVRTVDGGRPYLVAEIAAGGRALTVVGVHLFSPTGAEDSRRRNRQLDQIAGLVADIEGPAILAGDLNISPWSPHFRDLVAAAGLRNAADGHGWIATWPQWLWPARVPIDHVLIKGPLIATQVARGPAIGSDHYPLIADLRLIDG